jgi:hypothetical protein
MTAKRGRTTEQGSVRLFSASAGVGRPAVLHQPGVNVGPLSAGGTSRDDHMPGTQIV